MLHDLIANALSIIRIAEKAGKAECLARPTSNVLKEILKIMQKHGYIGDFEYVEDGRGGQFKIQLKGRINNCSVIKPRYPVKKDDYEKWEKRFLPAAGIGILIVSTSKGITSHREVKGKSGGTLIAYVH